MEKAEDVCEFFLTKDAYLKGYANEAESLHHEHVDGCQDIMYGVDFLNYEFISNN